MITHTDVDTTAPVLVHRHAHVRAPLEAVWRHHVEAAGWPRWNPEIAQVDIDGELAVGTTFTWRTHGLDITSVVTDVDPLAGTRWAGVTGGITGEHVWTFTAEEGGVRVDSVESWAGDPVSADVAGMRTALAGSLDTWLARLRTACESS